MTPEDAAQRLRACSEEYAWRKAESQL